MTAARPMSAYRPGEQLPAPGLSLLEASAGTGKTHTITELVRRFVAEEEIPLAELLVMTFSRSAAQELRDRIRRELRDYAESTAHQERRDRCRLALGQFDDAAIMTIHEFCIDAFARFGLRADADPGEQAVEDLSEVLQDAVADTYLSMFWQDPPNADPDAKRTDDLNPRRAHGLAKSLVGNPDAELLTLPEADLRPEQQRIDFAQRVTSAVARSKHETGTISFDDMVLRLGDAVHRDAAVRRQLRRRFRVVLVDEFQDTDPSQWAIVHEAFLTTPQTATNDTAVVLIGDPKQGIYSFRGADIHSYTAARDTPGATAQTLGTNYRSDRPVVHGVLDLLEGLELGPGIQVGPVDARHQATRITGASMDPEGLRVRLRVLTDPPAQAEPLRERVAQDVAAEITRTLRQGALIDSAQQGDGSSRPVVPGDFAVIVRSNKQAELVRSTLHDFGLPAVVNSQISVYASAAALSWLRLLRAMERPGGSELRAAALTEFLGTPASVLASPESPQMEQLGARVKHLASLFGAYGVPAVLAEAARDEDGTGAGMYARLLARPDGERLLTDLRHVGSLLHDEHRRSGRGLASLADWLEERVDEAEQDSDERAEALTRRLETDADAVQVLTIHRCKGLQFGIVYVPFAYAPSGGPSAATVCTTDQASDPPRMRRVIDVRSYRLPGKQQSQSERLKDLQKAETNAEELRMLYVAMTRAIHELVLWWAPHRDTPRSPLQRVLGAASGEPAVKYPCDPPPAKAVRAPHVKVQHVAAASIPDPPVPREHSSWGSRGTAGKDLTVAPYHRADIDTVWHRSSFTALTRGTQHSPGDTPEDDEIDEKSDEANLDHAAAARPSGALADDTPSPFAGLRGGTAFGTLVHAVLEHIDPQAGDLGEELLRGCEQQLARRPITGLSPQRLARSLLPALQTPLGTLAGDNSLTGIPARDRLAELDFEMPLQQDQSAAGTVASIGRLLAANRDAPPWIRGYGNALTAADFSGKQLRGYLTGSIDAVLRVGGRYLVVDYKTNLLGPVDGPIGDYRPEALRRAMAEAHYPLQALLYSAALHRFLQRRLPSYDPDRHLGGVLYLFLRGMAGPNAPAGSDGARYGVCSWRPAPQMVTELSALLGGVRHDSSPT